MANMIQNAISSIKNKATQIFSDKQPDKPGYQLFNQPAPSPVKNVGPFVMPTYAYEPVKNFAIGTAKTIYEPAKMFTGRLYEAATLPFQDKKIQQRTDNIVAESNRALQLAKQQRESGNSKMAAETTRSMIPSLQVESNKMDKRIADLQTGRRELVGSGVRTALNVAALNNPLAFAKAGTVGIGFNTIMGNAPKSWEQAGQQFAESGKYAGFNEIYSGVGQLLSKIPGGKDLLSKGVEFTNRSLGNKILVHGGTNLVEDIFYAKTAENRNLSLTEGILSFGVPALLDTGSALFSALRSNDSIPVKMVDNAVTTEKGVWDPKSGELVTNPKDIAIAKKNQLTYEAGSGKPLYQKGDVLVKLSDNKYVLKSSLQEYKSTIDKAAMEVEDTNAPKKAKIKVSPDGKAKIKADATPDEIISKAPEAPGKRRKFTQSILDSENVAPQVKEAVAKNETLYQPQTNKAQMKTARQAVAGDTTEALTKWTARADTVSLKDSTSYIAEGQALIEKLDMEGRFDEAATVATKMTELGTQSGQTTQAFDNLKQLSPSSMLQFARKSLEDARKGFEEGSFIDKGKASQITDLTPAESKKIYDLMSEATQLDNTDPRKTDLVKQAIEVFNQKIPVGAKDMFDSFRRENMLSNPLTHMRNYYSNLFNTFLYRPANLVAEATTDWIGSSLTGKARTAYFSDVPVYYRTAVNSVMDSSKLAMDYMKNPIEVNLKDNKIPELNYLSTPNKPGWMTFNTRLMQASDKLFNSMISTAEYAVQKNRGVDDKTALKNAQELAGQILYTKSLDLNNKTQQGHLATSIDKFTNGILAIRKHVPFGDWFVPFVQTPMNAVKEAVLASPAGFLNMPGNGKMNAQFAKSLLGSAVSLAFAQKAFQGEMTWATPTDPKEKELFYASGRKPYSVKIGDKWVPMQYFGPFSLAMMIPAAANYYQNESKTAMTDDQLTKLAAIVKAIGEYTVNQTAFANVGTMAKIFTGDMDVSLPTSLAFTSEQMVPFAGLLRYVSTLMDPVYRKVEGRTSGEKFVNQLKKDFFFSKGLKAYTTPTGEESRRDNINYVLPYAVGTEKSQYTPLLKLRTKELQMNAVANQAKKDAKAAIEGNPGSIKLKSISDPQTAAFAAYYGIDKVAKMPEGSIIDKAKKENAAYAKAVDLMEKAAQDGLDETVVSTLIDTLGLKYEDVKYYDIARQDNDVKSQYLADEVNKLSAQTNDRQQILLYLGQQRNQVNGELVASNGAIDNLVDEGVITYNEGKMLKMIDVVKGKGRVKITGRGRGAKLKVSLTPISTLISKGKSSSAKIKAVASKAEGAKISL